DAERGLAQQRAPGGSWREAGTLAFQQVRPPELLEGGVDLGGSQTRGAGSLLYRRVAVTGRPYHRNGIGQGVQPPGLPVVDDQVIVRPGDDEVCFPGLRAPFPLVCTWWSACGRH